MLTDAMRFAAAMLVGPKQARHDALCEALDRGALKYNGKVYAEISARTGIHPRMIKRDLDQFVRIWKWCVEGMHPPIKPEVAKLSVNDSERSDEPESDDQDR